MGLDAVDPGRQHSILATRAGWTVALVLAGCFLASPGSAEETVPEDSRWRSSGPARGVVPDDDELMRLGAVIGEVYIQTGNVFDHEEPGQDRFLFRLANRMHATTRPPVIERKLLFRSGDPYDPRVLEESERLLRSLDFLYDVWIEPIRYRGNRVDVLVRTRDVWTLGVSAGFERSGGANSSRFSIDESNLLGTGRFFDVKYSDDHDRNSSRVRYVDPALLGSRAELRLWYADNSDGFRRVFDLERPFFSLDSRWAGSTKLISDRRIERIYHQGSVVDRYHHERSFAELVSGFSRGYRHDRTRRWLVGYTWDRSQFWPEGTFPDEFLPDEKPLPPPGLPPRDPRPNGPDKGNPPPPARVLPAGRELSYFWIGYEEVEDGFIQTRNMDRIQRTEDFNLGLEVSARLGWSSTALGASADQAVFRADVRSGLAPSEGTTVFLSGYAGGRWGSGGHENVQVGGSVRFFLRTFRRHQLLATVHADAAWNLDPENQLLLGGDSGLRGYPLRFQDGDRRFLISLEQRFYTDWELFDLVHVGAAVFLDAGRAWYEEGPFQDDDLGLLKNVGAGLRLGSSRSSRGQVVHLDVAFPMDGGVDEVQWLVTSKSTF
jgi:hypothetical protein